MPPCVLGFLPSLILCSSSACCHKSLWRWGTVPQLYTSCFQKHKTKEQQPVPGTCYFFLSCWPVGVYRLPKVDLGYPPEFDGNLSCKHEQVKWRLIWKLHPHWLAFIVLEDAVCSATGRSSLRSHHAVDMGALPYFLHNYLHPLALLTHCS